MNSFRAPDEAKVVPLTGVVIVPWPVWSAMAKFVPVSTFRAAPLGSRTWVDPVTTTGCPVVARQAQESACSRHRAKRLSLREDTRRATFACGASWTFPGPTAGETGRVHWDLPDLSPRSGGRPRFAGWRTAPRSPGGPASVRTRETQRPRGFISGSRTSRRDRRRTSRCCSPSAGEGGPGRG